MLVLSRKPLQSITIGSDIKITIVKVERNQVRIGIEAPRTVTILRDELIVSGPAVSLDEAQPLDGIEAVSA